MGGRSGQSTGGGGGAALGSGVDSSNYYKNVNIIESGNNTTNKSPEYYLGLAGIPKDFSGNADIYYSPRGRVEVNIRGMDIVMDRVINPNDKSIYNAYFSIPKDSKFKGQGAQIFANQVKSAQKAGYDKIKVEAAGSLKDRTYNGYYTWARLGYIPTGNGSLASVRNIKNITGVDYGNFQTMMRTSSGIKAWKEHGTSFSGIFDLKKGSESMKTLNNYIKNKKQN